MTKEFLLSSCMRGGQTFSTMTFCPDPIREASMPTLREKDLVWERKGRRSKNGDHQFIFFSLSEKVSMGMLSGKQGWTDGERGSISDPLSGHFFALQTCNKEALLQ